MPKGDADEMKKKAKAVLKAVKLSRLLFPQQLFWLSLEKELLLLLADGWIKR